MAENSPLWDRINDHEKRLTTTEETVKQMAPRLHVSEIANKLEIQMKDLQKSVELSSQRTEQSITRLANDTNSLMTRLGEVNEENMKRAANLQEAELARANQALEDAKLINRIKSYWTPILVVVVTGATALGLASGVASWVIKNILLK